MYDPQPATRDPGHGTRTEQDIWERLNNKAEDAGPSGTRGHLVARGAGQGNEGAEERRLGPVFEGLGIGEALGAGVPERAVAGLTLEVG